MGHRGQAATRRVAHEAQAVYRRKRCGQGRDGSAIRLHRAAKFEFFPRQHHGNAMIPGRPADQQHIALANSTHAKPTARRT